MDLLERYLQAVGQYLPAETKDDTIAELRSNLMEQIDAREEELGQPLDFADVAAILKEHGKPEVVALRYLPQRSLIGPAIYPFYTLTLARVLPLVVLVSFLAKGIEFVSVRHESLAHALGGLALGVWLSLLISAAIITIIFAAIEIARERGRLEAEWNEWDPAKLPAVKAHEAMDFSPKSMVKRVIELSVHCLWMAYVLWIPWHPFWILGPGVFYMDSLNVALGPVWHTFYELLIVLLVVQLAMKLLAFVPSAQRAMMPMKIVTDLLGLATTGLLAASSTYFVAAGAAANVQKIATVNQSVGLAFQIVFVIVLIGFVRDLWQYVKRAKPLRQMAF
jgi:hypothetical protein